MPEEHHQDEVPCVAATACRACCKIPVIRYQCSPHPNPHHRVSFNGSCSLICGATSLISSLVLVYVKVRFHQLSGLVVKDCKTLFFGGVSPVDIPSAVIRSCWRGCLQVTHSFDAYSVHVLSASNCQTIGEKDDRYEF